MFDNQGAMLVSRIMTTASYITQRSVQDETMKLIKLHFLVNTVPATTHADSVGIPEVKGRHLCTK